MKIIIMLFLIIFGFSNVSAKNYTLDDIVNISKKNWFIKNDIIFGKLDNNDQNFNIELVKSKNGIDMIFTTHDEKETYNIKYNEKENTLEINYIAEENINKTGNYRIATIYLFACLSQLSPYYEEIINNVFLGEEHQNDNLDIPGFKYMISNNFATVKIEVSDTTTNYLYKKYIKGTEKPSTNNPSTSATNYTVDDIINASTTNYTLNYYRGVKPNSMRLVKANDGGIDILFYDDIFQHIKYNKSDNTLEIYNKKDPLEDSNEDNIPIQYSYLSSYYIGSCLSQLSPYHKEIMNYIYYKVDPAITNKFIMNQDNKVEFPGFEYNATQNEIHVKMELSNKAANYVYKTYINKDVEIPEEQKPIENSEEQKPIVTQDKQKPTESKPEEQPSKNNNTDGENPPTGAFLNIGLLSFVAIGAIIGITINRRNKKIHKI